MGEHPSPQPSLTSLTHVMPSPPSPPGKSVCILNPKFVFYIAAVAEEHETSPPHFTEPEVSEGNIPESLTWIVKSILFVEEETAKQITVVFFRSFMHSFFLVFYFVCLILIHSQSEMKNNTEQQNFNTCLSWKAGVSLTASQNITNQTFCEVHISEFKQMSHSRLSSSKVVIRRVWRIRLFDLVMCLWFF